MNLPNGERLLLTIDRVVERMCENCAGCGDAPESLYAGDMPEAWESGGKCYKCHGTGVRKVRLRGYAEVCAWCETNDHIGYEAVWPGQGYEGSPSAIAEWVDENDRDKAREQLTDIIIAAHLAGTLPEGVAHIEEVDDGN